MYLVQIFVPFNDFSVIVGPNRAESSRCDSCMRRRIIYSAVNRLICGRTIRSFTVYMVSTYASVYISTIDTESGREWESLSVTL